MAKVKSSSLEKNVGKTKIQPIDKYVTEISKSKTSALDIGALEDWLWKAACSIRGPIDAPKFKDYILPLVFVKRLSDVFDDEIKRLEKQFGDKETAIKLVEADHSLVRFFIPSDSKWEKIHKITSNLGEKLTDAIRDITKHNPSLQGVIDIVDFNATVSGQRILEDGRLSSLIEILSDPRYRLGLDDVEPDILGRAYEYLLRKFAEGQGSSAGEFFTPKEVAWLMAYILDPKQGQTVYDPTCGSGGLLIKCQLVLEEKEKGKEITMPLKLHGQETNHITFAIARMNMIIHDMEGNIAIGDSLRNPKFLNNSSLEKFDLVAANPMWNQKEYTADFYENDVFDRFKYGQPPANTADWGWIQHMFSSLNDQGKAAIVLDTGSVSRGGGDQEKDKEKDIRKTFIENDWIEGVILLPENLFYNTNAPGIILVLNKSKQLEHKNKIILINASQMFKKGKPKNFIPDDKIKQIVDTFHTEKDIDKFVKIVTKEEITKTNYNLNPSRYVGTNTKAEYRHIPTLLEEFSALENKSQIIETELKNIFQKLGYDWYR